MMRKLILVSTLVLSSSVAFAQFTGPSVERDSQTRNDRMGQMQDRPCVNNPDGQPCDFSPQKNSQNNDRSMNRQHRQQINQQDYRGHHQRGEHRQMHNNDRREHRQYQHNNNESRQGQYHRTGQRAGEMRQHSGDRQQMHQRQDCPYNR